MNKETMEFYGFNGDPEHDAKRRTKIINEVGADNFDIDYPMDYDEKIPYPDPEYRDYVNQEVANINSK